MSLEPPAPIASAEEPPLTFGEVLRAATPVVWVTPAVVSVNVAVWLVMVAAGVSPLAPAGDDLYRWGADFGPATALEGQWWRLLTSAFVHVGAVHLALNMYVFSSSGPLCERLYGNLAFLALYLLAALGGSLAATIWSPLALSAGASGAVFGVYGALFAFTRTARHSLPPEVISGLRKSVVSFVVLNVLFGLTVPNISNSAHLGGLATGFVAGWLLARPLHGIPGSPPRRYARAAALLPVLAALGGVAYLRVSKLPFARASRLASEVEAALKAKSWDEARVRLDEAIAISPDESRFYLSRGYVRERLHDREGAIADYGDAISRDPESPAPLARRCSALYYAAELERASADCDAAIALDANHAEAWHGRAEILWALGREDEALQAARRAAELSPEWAHVHLLAARLSIAKGDLPAGEREIASAASRWPREQEVATTRSDLLLRRGDLAAARAAADLAVSLDPGEPWGYTQRASVARAAGDLDGALADDDRALALDERSSSLHNGRAWTLLHLGRLPDALAAVERALALDPLSPHALGTRCWIRASGGDLSGARPDCKLAVKRWPSARLEQGMLAFLEGRLEEAARIWKDELVQQPEDAALVRSWIAKTERGRR
jgi:rhomboid protease GluP